MGRRKFAARKSTFSPPPHLNIPTRTKSTGACAACAACSACCAYQSPLGGFIHFAKGFYPLAILAAAAPSPKSQQSQPSNPPNLTNFFGKSAIFAIEFAILNIEFERHQSL